MLGFKGLTRPFKLPVSKIQWDIKDPVFFKDVNTNYRHLWGYVTGNDLQYLAQQSIATQRQHWLDLLQHCSSLFCPINRHCKSSCVTYHLYKNLKVSKHFLYFTDPPPSSLTMRKSLYNIYWTQDYTFVHVLIRPTLCNKNLMEN